MDNQKPGYHINLINELKKIKVDLVRVFLMTAWPGTSLYNQLEKENRESTEWDKLRKDIPTLKYKHYSNSEIIEAREKIMKTFFCKSHVLKIVLRWVLRDASAIGVFLKIWWRNKMPKWDSCPS